MRDSKPKQPVSSIPYYSVVRTWAVGELDTLFRNFAMADGPEQAEAAKDELLRKTKEFLAVVQASDILQRHLGG